MDDVKMENSILRQQLSVLRDLDGPHVADEVFFHSLFDILLMSIVLVCKTQQST